MTDRDPTDRQEDVDETPPILGLATLEEDVPPELSGRVVNSIHRRMLAGDLLDVTWNQLIAVVTEFLAAAFSVFGGGTETRNNTDQREGDGYR